MMIFNGLVGEYDNSVEIVQSPIALKRSRSP
jgi:hypothetical protein